jgi:hypothetical protein
MWLHVIFFVCIFYTCHVSSSYPLVRIIPILHCTPTESLISSMKHSKHFSNLNWYLDVQGIFKSIMSVVKQSCGQSKQVYILTNVYFDNWIGDYTYWMYLIWHIFHPLKTTWLDWWLGEFPSKHPPYLYIVFIVGWSKA